MMRRLTRSVDPRGGDLEEAGTLDLGPAVAVGVVAVAVCFLAVVGTWYCYRRSQRRRSGLRLMTWKPTKAEALGSSSQPRPRVLRSRSGRLLSVLDFGKARRPQVDAFSPTRIQESDYKPHPVELDGGESGEAVLKRKETLGQDIGPIAQYQAANMSSSLWQEPGTHSDSPLTTSTLTTPRPAAWQGRRSAPPPPILIAPPQLTRNSPYRYDSVHNAHYPVPSGASSIDGFSFVPDSASSSSSHSFQSVRSYRSNEPLHAPATPRSIRSVSELSRRDSGTHVETPTLLPPTPTYSPSMSQSRKIPVDTVNFVCLGPLPDNIPLPSPRQFQEQKQQQQQLAAQSSYRAASPEQQKRSRGLSASKPLGRSHPTSTFHDVILHKSNGLRPQPSPETSVFREHSLRAHVAHVDDDDDDDDVEDGERFGSLRCQSTDSLGSNFTVEEEERIQAQIAKNLATLGQERVVGTTDIVHIPQFSERRYSWEEV